MAKIRHAQSMSSFTLSIRQGKFVTMGGRKPAWFGINGHSSVRGGQNEFFRDGKLVSDNLPVQQKFAA
jgi:hypothetical protein